MRDDHYLYPKALPPRDRLGIDDPALEARAKIFWLLIVFPLVATLSIAGAWWIVSWAVMF